VKRAAYTCFSVRWPLAWIALGLVIVGCAKSQPAQQSNLRLISVLYGQFRASHRGDLPRDEKEFKDFIAKEHQQALSNTGVSSVDELLVSKRDGKPYAIKYQSTKDWPLEGMIAYEQEGVDGSRQVANDLGGTTELNEEQFQANAAKSK
jgi:hypothetical protein